MGELLKQYFQLYACVTLFAGVWLFVVILAIIKNTKRIAKQKARTILCIALCSILTSLWMYFFVYHQLFPASLAYYEYNHNIAEETTGTIDDIEQLDKDHIRVTIDNQTYIAIHSTRQLVHGIGTSINKGDTVRIRFGKQSMYIFDIVQCNVATNTGIG